MTLPFFLALTLTESDSITLGLAASLATSLVLGAMAYARLQHRVEVAEKDFIQLVEQVKALEDWRVRAERETGEVRQEVREVRRLLESMAADIRDIRHTVHQQETRRSA